MFGFLKSLAKLRFFFRNSKSFSDFINFIKFESCKVKKKSVKSPFYTVGAEISRFICKFAAVTNRTDQWLTAN